MEVVVICLTILLIASNTFWILCTQKLLNKLMSRNYNEYVTAERSLRAVPKVQVPTEDPSVKMMEEKRAMDLNQIMGMV